MVNIIIVAYSVIAAVIGAGFASGQEMLLYFVHFKHYGIFGLILCAVLFTGFIYIITSTCIRQNYTEYSDFLTVFKSHVIRRIVKASTLVFSFAVYGAMLSCSGELLYDFFSIPHSIGTLICAFISTILFYISGDKIFTANGVLGVFLVLVITFCALYMLSYREFHVFSNQGIRATASSLVYSGYNLVSLVPVLVPLSKRLRSRTDCVGVSLCVGTATTIIMALIFGLLSIYYGKIDLGELPMLTLARRQSAGFAFLYSAVLSTAILTTLIASGGGLCDALQIKRKPIMIALVSVCAYALASLGFSRLIDTAYRICGIIGFAVCAISSVACLRTRRDMPE